MAVITEVVTQIGQTAVIVAGASWLAKSIFSSWLSKNVETHKSELNKSVELYKIELQRELQLFQIRNSKLHIDRSEVIKDIYNIVDGLHGQLIFIFRRGGKTWVPEITESYYLKLEEWTYKLFDCFRSNRFYFNDELQELIQKIIKLTMEVSEFISKDDITKENKNIIILSVDEITTYIVIVQKLLRRLLGVIDEEGD
ncbi:hypothetical protein [Paenibacillus illinoisensis]|uniref:hypothetical protein n=1 Tax=Paenibacillus illinoisensis TaxID=59845 RepID=UPI0020412C64|nr:hypothetical protein [Paenibacillus illinoisensis]MCM3206372.1 hypothetical protein [Paenibacillus illinoisensis]